MSKSIPLQIVTLGIPLVVGQLGAILQSFADTIMVGNYGTLELSAAGFVNNVFNLVIFFILGISYGTTPIVGELFGKKDKIALRRTFRESVLVNFLVSVVVVCLLTLLYYNIEFFDQPEELLPLIRPYFLCQLASIPFLALFNSQKQFSDALGQTRTPMWIMLISNVINIVLNYLLIFGQYGFPELGLLGAGVATLIARMFMPAAMCLAFLTKSYQRELKVDNKSLLVKLDVNVYVTRQGMWHLLIVGLPIAIQLLLEASAFNITAIFMGWIGAIPLAAHQVMNTVSTLCFQVMYGVGAAAAILISQYRGEQDWRLVKKTVKTAYIMNLCCSATMVTFIAVTFHYLVGMFTQDEAVINVTTAIFPCFVVYQFGDCTQITFANVLRGLESVKRMMLYAFIAYIIVSIPLSYTFAFLFHWGAVGVWAGIPFGLTTAGILFYIDYRKHISASTITI